jgi:hypothetical protein
MGYDKILRDAVGLLGIGLMSAAAYLVHPVLGLFAAGALLFGLSVAGTLRNRKP